MKHYQCADDVKITNVNVRDEKKMGTKHLRKIRKLFSENPDNVFPQSYFTYYENISYNTALDCLQYLWEVEKKIELTPKGYRWKKGEK